ncbi:hypothetical protein [Kitasatospora sp. NBC_01539]|uniref:hypothetical protein n=1 Tax=Kitasatospora sp. NBC_01539 TaxID=2903577 RepID=UPI0038600F1C
MSDWQVFLQDQPARALDRIAGTDRELFILVTIALTQIGAASGDPVDEWGDLRSVVLAPTVTAEIFVNADAVPPAIDVVRLVWLVLD